MNVAKAGFELVKANPVGASITATVATGVGLVAAPVLAWPAAVAVLNAVGFTSGGVAAGSMAAASQAAVGNVIAPSLFATLTSAGMGGYGVASVMGAVQVAGGTMAGAAGAVGALLYKK